jgi:hypothetical protein
MVLLQPLAQSSDLTRGSELVGRSKVERASHRIGFEIDTARVIGDENWLAVAKDAMAEYGSLYFEIDDIDLRNTSELGDVGSDTDGHTVVNFVSLLARSVNDSEVEIAVFSSFASRAGAEQVDHGNFRMP